MAEVRHNVRFTIGSPLELTKADVTFKVRRDGKLFGTLLLSRGAVEWKPRSGKQPLKVKWKKFDELMREGRKKRRK